jgi:glutaminase
VVPGKLAVAAFSPRLNQAGNRVRIMRAIEYVSGRLKLGLFQ